ncbi:cytochrome P450 4V2 [Caerostris darwini]|uniref:Cytochrome P450 4V2 n=1 Tax=Caerostris darwini TaxID=1538125 RepID=A0AAV4NLX9_9ARAC|nr:cytochrome P450 4V2 [Caerostris darwini]
MARLRVTNEPNRTGLVSRISLVTKSKKSLARRLVSRKTPLLQVGAGYSYLFQNSPLFCFWMSYMPYIIIKKAEAVEAFVKGTKNLEKSMLYNMLHIWLGTGLLTSHGSKWKSRRKLLTPSFHFEILKDFLPIFNEQSQVLVNRLQREVTRDFTDIVEPITLCSLDIICGKSIYDKCIQISVDCSLLAISYT